MLDFKAIAHAAVPYSYDLCLRWLPDGTLKGHEWYARNPMRADKNVGSFHVNVHSGKWGDFAAGISGGDLISLAAYLFHEGDQAKAARSIALMLGIAA